MSATDDLDPGFGRDETSTERNDRNWTEMLQELRVIQTGTQILTGFLLTLPFQARFTALEGYEVIIYLALVCTAVVATLLALAPVAVHRARFRQRAKNEIVLVGDRLLKATLIAVALTLVGTCTLIFDVVIGLMAGLVAGGAALLLAAIAWIVVPMNVRRNSS